MCSWSQLKAERAYQFFFLSITDIADTVGHGIGDLTSLRAADPDLMPHTMLVLCSDVSNATRGSDAESPLCYECTVTAAFVREAFSDVDASASLAFRFQRVVAMRNAPWDLLPSSASF